MNAFQKSMFVCLIIGLCSFSFAGSLVGHWKLDETSGTTAYDSAGTYNGTLVGSPLPVWTNGMIDGALSFSGAQGVCISGSSGSASPLNIYNSNITLVAWIKPAVTGGGTIISRAKEHYIAYRIYSPDGKKVTLNTYRSPTHWLLTTGDVLTPGNWYHVVGVFDRDSDTGIIYVNGVEQARSTSMTTDPYSCDAPTTIGYRNNTGDYPYNGVVDDARIYNYALDANEVAALYGQVPQSGLVGHWKLDETSGNVAYDSAGTNNGTVSGALWTTGKIDGGLDFDGIDDGVIIPDNDVLTPANTMTLSYWAYNTGNGADLAKYASCTAEPASPGNSRAYALNVSNTDGRVKLTIFASVGSSDSLYSVNAIPLNQWHLVTATFDNGAAKIYIDGILDNSKTMAVASIMNDAQPLTIGGTWSYCGTDTWLGVKTMMDDVRIYNYALSDVEVAALYNQSPLPHVATTYHVATTGLDTNAGTTKATAFATIQKGIDTAVDGDTVVVWPGTYDQQANFNGKAITVRSADAEPAVISNSSDYAFVFENAEEANSVLQNFIIAKGCFAVYVSGSSPTIKNLTIVDNYFGIDAYDGATPAVSNCIFLNNRFGDIEGADTQYSWPFDLTAAACWSFEETTGTKVYDGIGNSDGIIAGAAREPNGLLGRAMSFDGSGDYIAVPNNASLNITGDITMAAWVKPTSFSTNIRCIAIKPYAYELIIKNTNPLFRLSGSGGIRDKYTMIEKTFTDLAFVLNQWNYIVVKREGALVKAWLNGKESAQTANVSSTATIAVSPYPFSIGTVVTSSPYPYYFVGQIDEVALFDRALSIKEIENYYELMQAGYYYTDPMMVDSGNGDYHLLSEFGRYDLNSAQWVLDDITSPCVDAGDPADNPMGEPMPNGGRINIGAYGGMGHASKGGEWPLPFDFNTDGIVNMADFAKLAEHWLEKLPWVE
ncbi:MAG: LamG domain-containing protein [Sedimentisphaerales bacterium]